MFSSFFTDLMEKYKDYIDITRLIYQLNVNTEEEINALYNDIKTKLIESKLLPVYRVFGMLKTASIYRNRYYRSYLTLMKKFFDEYHMKYVLDCNGIFSYLFYKEYGIIISRDLKSTLKEYEAKKYSVDVHEENTIYRAIMTDNLDSFRIFADQSNFDQGQLLKSYIYPLDEYSNGLSLLEVCCYHGAVECFKYLRTNFNFEITNACLKYSLFGGNSIIINECFQYIDPDASLMEYAIITHNIDFVVYLMNNYNMEIDLVCCFGHSNLHAFLIYMNHSTDINNCFVNSIGFGMNSLSRYFIEHGVDVNLKESELGNSILHCAVLENNMKMVKYLVSHGANINLQNNLGDTPLLIAFRYIRIAEILISNGANVNIRNEREETILHYAAKYSEKEFVEILISNGANINAKDHIRRTPLHNSMLTNNKETAECLLSHGAEVNAKDNNGNTPLHLAAIKNSKEAAEVLLKHGAEVDAQDNNGKTALNKAIENSSREMRIILVFYGAKSNAL